MEFNIQVLCQEYKIPEKILNPYFRYQTLYFMPKNGTLLDEMIFIKPKNIKYEFICTI